MEEKYEMEVIVEYAAIQNGKQKLRQLKAKIKQK